MFSKKGWFCAKMKVGNDNCESEKIEKHNLNKIRGQLIRALKALFGFNKRDSDFGVYRILNFRRKEVEGFIERGLFENISNEMKVLNSSDEIKGKVANLRDYIKENFGIGIEEALKKKAETWAVREYIRAKSEADGSINDNNEIFKSNINRGYKYKL